MKNKLFITTLIFSLIVVLSSTYTIATAPSMPGQNQPGGNSSANISHVGATTIDTDTTETGATYSSKTGGQNALLITGGTSNITNPTITKSGDESSESSDFYGTNAAVIATNGILDITGAKITTNGGHANGVFSYGEGTINIEDSTITTSSNNSGGLMVTGGGILSAKNLTVTTEGNSSAPIRSDRGGGTLTVNGGNYTANGVGSPVIYSTADITVSNATLTSNKSEGAIVEGKNSITLDNVILVDTNNQLNGQSTTYKNIFLYQSMSGDADTGTSSFSALNSTITTNNGDTIYVTNTEAVISLTETNFINKDTSGNFLRIESGPWGKAGSNGGDVQLNATNQDINGNIVVDSISSLALNFEGICNYTGIINGDNKAKSIDLTLSKDTVINLTGDSYIKSLTNELTDNSNIILNGYTLYVNEKAIEETAYNTNTNTISNTTENKTSTTDTVDISSTTDTVDISSNSPSNTVSNSEVSSRAGNVIIVGSVIIILVILILIFVKKKYNE